MNRSISKQDQQIDRLDRHVNIALKIEKLEDGETKILLKEKLEAFLSSIANGAESEDSEISESAKIHSKLLSKFGASVITWDRQASAAFPKIKNQKTGKWGRPSRADCKADLEELEAAGLIEWITVGKHERLKILE